MYALFLYRVLLKFALCSLVNDCYVVSSKLFKCFPFMLLKDDGKIYSVCLLSYYNKHILHVFYCMHAVVTVKDQHVLEASCLYAGAV